MQDFFTQWVDFRKFEANIRRYLTKICGNIAEKDCVKMTACVLTCLLKDVGNGYIVAKSLLKSKESERDWAYSEDGYKYVGADFKYKSRIISRKVTDENGNSRTISEKAVVYWSHTVSD